MNFGQTTSTDSAAQKLLRTPSVLYSATSSAGDSGAVSAEGSYHDGEVEENLTPVNNEKKNEDSLSPMKPRRQLKRMQSINRLMSGGGAGKLEKARSRRMAHANQEIKILEITRTTRGMEKLKIPNKGEVFKFDCEGEIDTYGNETAKKHVKWHATFDKPIEQLIYPSLQRFDNEGYEEKRKVYRQLHGHYETGITKTSPPTGAKNTDGTAPVQYSYSENHGIKLDLLPDAANVSSDIMFLYTPKWTVEVTDAKTAPKDDHKKVTLSPIASSPLSTMKRKSTTPKSAQGRRQSKFQHHLSSSRDRLEDDDNSYHDSDNYSISSEEYESEKLFSARLNRKNYRSVIDEIEEEGEKFLRKQIKEHYEVRMKDNESHDKEAEDSSLPFYELRKTLFTMQKDKTHFPPIVQNNADNLVRNYSFIDLSV
jgi:hypothetical protein